MIPSIGSLPNVCDGQIPVELRTWNSVSPTWVPGTQVFDASLAASQDAH